MQAEKWLQYYQVKMSLCMPWNHMGDWRYSSTHTWPHGQVSGQLHVPAAITPGKSPCYQWMHSWVGSSTSLQTLEKITICYSCWELIHNFSVVQHLAQSLYQLCCCAPLSSSLILWSILWQVRNLFQGDISTKCKLVLPCSVSNILSFP